jgi:UDP-N-acetylmuramoylalanine--D-glutamate ligase
VKASLLGIPVYSEIEIASWFCENKVIGITGTNGKTTTTMLVEAMFKVDMQSVKIAGNIGFPLCDVVVKSKKEDILVTELSSFQLQGTDKFCPNIACLTNLSPAHLDYHGDFGSYKEAKEQLFKNQTNHDYAVLPNHYEIENDKVNIYRFSANEPVERGTMIKKGMIVYKNDGKEQEILSVYALKLKGFHNLENVCAATTIAMLAGASVAGIAKALSTFTGAKHRLQWVTTQDQITFINDSKATNVLAVKTALEAYKNECGIVHIAGGKERGEDLSSLGALYEGNISAGIYIGESKEKWADFARRKGVSCVRVVQTMEEAVEIAVQTAKPTEVILLSPGNASWDMYDSFEKRGDAFISAIQATKEKE